LIGVAVPFMFSSRTIRAVERAASRVVMEVRRQFREHPGIMAGTEKPEYGRVVDIVTRDSLRELATPGLIAVLTPVAVGFGLGVGPLGAYLGGVILSGQLLAVMLSNAGGAWDNAKKLIEEGAYGGKGSESHKAGVIGDTVGDPFKDTAGPALNPLIKVMNLVALLIVAQVVGYAHNGPVRFAAAGLSILVIVVTIAITKRRKTEELTETAAVATPPTPHVPEPVAAPVAPVTPSPVAPITPAPEDATPSDTTP